MRLRFSPRVACLPAVALMTVAASARQQTVKTAEVIIHTAQEGCVVELDSVPTGKTDGLGNVTLSQVEPGAHYVHIQCPSQDESGHFVSPVAGAKTEINTTKSETVPPAADANASLQVADARIRLRRLVQQAVQARARGRFDEAIPLLRQAIDLDPDNADLHCELGITFLLGKDWKTARVEMLEALHHDPNNADAHNGLGYALEKLGDLDAALKEYRLATRLDPDDPTYRTHYFDALSRLAQQKATKK